MMLARLTLLFTNCKLAVLYLHNEGYFCWNAVFIIQFRKKKKQEKNDPRDRAP